MVIMVIRRQIFLFYKSRCGKCSLKIKLFIKYSSHNTERPHLLHQAISNILRNIKRDLLNFRAVQNGYRQDFQYLMVSIHFFLQAATLKRVLHYRFY